MKCGGGCKYLTCHNGSICTSNLMRPCQHFKSRTYARLPFPEATDSHTPINLLQASQEADMDMIPDFGHQQTHSEQARVTFDVPVVLVDTTSVFQSPPARPAAHFVWHTLPVLDAPNSLPIDDVTQLEFFTVVHDPFGDLATTDRGVLDKRSERQ